MMTDTPSHFAWSESGVCNADRGSPGGGSPNGAELERAKSADNAKVLGRGTDFGRTFLEFGSSDFAQIFRVPRGGGPRRGAKNFRNLTREFRENLGQSTPWSKISTPHIFPKWGAIPPKHNLFLLGSPGL